MKQRTVINDLVPSATPSEPHGIERYAQLRSWNAVATEWAREQILNYLGTTDIRPITAAGVMTHLDKLAAPAGYELLRADYQRRYHWVRRILNKMVTGGRLQAKLSTNTRQRAATAYEIPRPASEVTQSKARRRRAYRGTSSYEVLIDGGSPEIQRRIEDILKEHAAELRGASVLITPKG